MSAGKKGSVHWGSLSWNRRLSFLLSWTKLLLFFFFSRFLVRPSSLVFMGWFVKHLKFSACIMFLASLHWQIGWTPVSLSISVIGVDRIAPVIRWSAWFWTLPRVKGRINVFPGHVHNFVCIIFLYACETWTITADTKRRIQALEMRCFRKLFDISYRDHITNEEVKARIGNAIGPYEDLLTSVQRCKLKWYGQVTRSSGLAKAILQGTVQGGTQRGRQRKWLEDNIKEWTGLGISYNGKSRTTRNGGSWL